MTKQIPLGGKKGAGLFALVDDADYEELSQYKWHLFSGAYANRNLLQSEEGKGGMLMHRQILRIPGGIDHKDGDGLNNTRDNLRPANQSQNNMNAKPRKNSTSQYKGVYWTAYYGRWQARIQINGKSTLLGKYLTQREAALAYNEAAELHFGEYARLNEIIDDPSDLPVAEPRPPKTAKYRGVCWDKSRTLWSVKIMVNQRTINLGRFTSEVEAARAYDAAARIHHGAKAKLNFP